MTKMQGEKEGIDAALGRVVVGAPPVGPARQLPLPVVGADERGAHEGLLAAVDRVMRGGNEVQQRGPGRPAGAPNKRTTAWVEYLLNQYSSPLVVLAETYSRPVNELAKELGCDRESAYRLQIAAAQALAPYLHQKQPLAVQIDAKGVVHLTIHRAPVATVGAGAGPGAGARVISGQVLDLAVEEESEQDQGLSEGESGRVGQTELDNDAENGGN